MSRHKAAAGRRVYSSPVMRYAMAIPIWAGSHLDILEDRDLRLTRHSRFSTMRLGRHHRVIPFVTREAYKIDKNTWAIVAEDGGLWYFGTFDQCRAMLDRIEMHQARFAMAEGTMAEGFV